MDVMEIQENAKERRNSRKWFIGLLLSLVGCLAAGGLFVVVVDPFFHYHAPLTKLQYPLMRENERYQTDGILRNFDYDAIIIGTSMTECFQASQMDALFGVNTVKTPLAGCNFRESAANLRRAFEAKDDIKMVLRSFEYQAIPLDKDEVSDLYDYAEYLTNDNPLDDAPYVLNKEVVGRAGQVLLYTLKGNTTTSFDEYANWMYRNYFGPFYVYTSYEHDEPTLEKRVMTEEERIQIRGNLQQNVISLANENPNTTFYLFIPPYSIGYWDQVCNNNELEWHLEMERIAMEEVLECPNIKLFSYSMEEYWILDLNNYCDLEHYADWVNYGMLQKMAKGEGLITKENYLEYIEAEREYFGEFDYQAFWEEQL